MWFLGLDGTTAVAGQDAAVDASFSDIFDVLNIALMLNMEWNNGKWFVVVDPMWSELETEYATPGPIPGGGNIDVTMWLVDALAGYMVNENVGVYAGVRYYEQDLDITPTFLPVFSLGDSWTDFMLGVRAHGAIADKWSIAAKIDGAVAGDSDSAWYIQAVLMRHFGDSMHLDFGWRYYDVDYESGSGLTRFKWDVAHSGPMLGFSWQF
jgi:hypothetical protein